MGDPRKGIEYLTSALRLSPRDFSRWNTLLILGLVAFLAREYASGIEWAKASLQEVPRNAAAHMALALNYVGLGQIANGSLELQALQRLDANFLRSSEASRSNFARTEDRQKASLFLQVAAGKVDPKAIESLR